MVSNTINAQFTLGSGTSTSGFSESYGNVIFTSGDGIKIEGNVSHSAEQEYAVADYGMTQADGIFLENLDGDNEIVLKLKTASGGGSIVSTLSIAPLGCFLVRLDIGQTAITHIGVQGSTATCSFVLCLVE